MRINKDTPKVREALKIVINYCNRYEHCRGCLFFTGSKCSIGYPAIYQHKPNIREVIYND